MILKKKVQEPKNNTAISLIIIFIIFIQGVRLASVTPIDKNERVIVKSHGVISYTDKQGRLQKREGPVYLHFLEDCLKEYFTEFEYKNIEVPVGTNKLLEADEKVFLKSLGVVI